VCEVCVEEVKALKVADDPKDPPPPPKHVRTHKRTHAYTHAGVIRAEHSKGTQHAPNGVVLLHFCKQIWVAIQRPFVVPRPPAVVARAVRQRAKQRIVEIQSQCGLVGGWVGGRTGRQVGRMRSGTECNCEALLRYAGPKWHTQMKIAMRKQEGKKRRDDSKTNHVRSPVAGDRRPVLLNVWDDLIPKVEIRHFFRGDCRRSLGDALCVEAVQRGDERILYPNVMTRETLGAVLSTVCAQELVVDTAGREVLGQGHVELALCEPLKALVAMQHALIVWPWFAAAVMERHDRGGGGG
jgi:hypothetical protein